MNSDQTSSPVRSRRRLVAAVRRLWIVASLITAACAGAGAAISAANWPVPRVHDEFSYLLAADTFAHGRLANPTHPEWEHFETFHEIFQPTYASKYPPGQGVVLAVGQVLGGDPLVGVWLLSGLGAAATYWMLLGCAPPVYAALGALLWAAHPRFQLAWGQSYWGGTLGFIGGAIVFGAAARMVRRTTTTDALALAGGAVILALTRPYEGLAFCLAVGAWVLWSWRVRGGPTRRDFLVKLAAPAAVVLGLGGVALGTYNHAVTGSAATFPYSLHESRYGQTPMLLLNSPPAPPAYRYSEIEDFHSGWEKQWYTRQSTLRGWLSTKFAVTMYSGYYFLTPVIAAAALACRPWRWRRLTPAVGVAAATYAATLAVTWYNPHYFAPFIPLLFVASAAGLRRIDVYSRQWFGGWRAAPILVLAQVVMFVMAATRHVQTPQPGWALQRAAIAEELAKSPGRHVIFVSYGVDHNCHSEWVFNGADIDSSKVVWARSMGSAGDAELMGYYPHRQAWLCEPEAQRLVPLDPDAAALAATTADVPSRSLAAPAASP